MTITIRPLAAADRPGWEAVWVDYLASCATDLPARVTEATWARLLDPAEAGFFGLVAVDDDREVVGLVHCVLHANTWSERPVCYLEDLCVAPEARRRRVGRRLIGTVIAEGREAGWRRIYWMTQHDNVAARTLYDRITPVTSWVRYDVPL